MTHSGRHFLQIPGPTNTPLPVLAAVAKPTIDHRGPDFQKLGEAVLAGIRSVFKTSGPVIIYPASGTGAWEAALVNTLSPGDHVLMFETGWFATLWNKMAGRLGISAEFLKGDWRSGADAGLIEARLREDRGHAIKAVCVVHNETSTGATSNIAAVRRAIDNARHPALLLVDTISSLASIDYRHEEWGVDVTVGGSQKGLMLPPGLSFNAISEKALAAAKKARLPRSFWDWEDMLAANKTGYFPYTPATNLLQGLKVALDMLHEEGLDNVFARHDRAAEATRRAVIHWGLEIQCRNPAEYSSSLTAVRLPEGHSADGLRAEILRRSNMSLGNGLGPLADQVFRIGHLGDFHDLMVMGTLAGVEMGLAVCGIPHRSGGVEAAMKYLNGNAGSVAHAAE
ncbi:MULTISPECIES: aminotransferase class V-fold PLP-dependent enzyme [unclassified Ensifer]|uniref:pyridoxal-phosphate-dependent aminotransferase family protein n=1 Tax=unclassified Ensifer TaxID=2633371 RepID=UPI000812F28D|nr:MULTISPECIES: aminotransferase class V-fold PLP-dependent enzyme [unclassified Ensifer]OCO98867.1 serine--glyoxylate aminotransferase [Ensifer sp. LC14]OCP02635.1 serine--glyoxylate aminotransferase [Ensifer sp. LC11]OCP02969.1 serine--glyoxylate aminotransferase [Ensifer sp. LC13]OCP29900.1 serine--glyoxylate aminotransferase [Ensifer sp. LC499]